MNIETNEQLEQICFANKIILSAEFLGEKILVIRFTDGTLISGMSDKWIYNLNPVQDSADPHPEHTMD